MAKVMISFPDDLLEQVDAQARERGMTRSGLLQALAQREFSDAARSRRERVDLLLSRVASFDGRGTAHVRRDRDTR